MDAIQHLLSVPQAHADRTFLIEARTGQEFSFQQVHDQARRVAADLVARGIQPGDGVALVLENSAAFAFVYLGCLYARAMAIPVNPALGASEVRFMVPNSGARLVVVSGKTGGLLSPETLASQGARLLHLDDGLGGPATEGAEHWDLAVLPEASDFQPLEGASPSDPVAMIFTSGTTGRPMGIVHTIANMIDNARVFSEVMGIGPESRLYGILAMTYNGGYYNLLMLPWASGASVVLSHTFNAMSALRFWEPARRYGVNTLWLVPTVLAILLKMDRGRDGEAFCRSEVRLSLVGTAPLPIPLRRSFEKRYGLTLLENYALSEVYFLTSNRPEAPSPLGSVGQALPGVQLSIVDDKGLELKAGEPGEVRIRSPHLLLGYHDLDDHSLQPIDSSRWFPTGDVGQFDSDGHLSITGRKKDIIIRGGVNISPLQVEQVLYDNEAVTECAVVGIPHSLHGEDVAAAVSILENADAELVRSALLEACSQKLSAAKRPAEIIFMDALPHNASGKLQKREARRLVLERLGRGDEA